LKNREIIQLNNAVPDVNQASNIEAKAISTVVGRFAVLLLLPIKLV